ncbi:MAG: hypothetical protein ACK587_15795 [Cyanobacteriota bacterium]
MTNQRRSLTLPAEPLLVRERLKLVSPSIIRSGPSPLLLSFSNTGFIETFLALAKQNQPVADTELPPLLAWRDWSEPPQALLEASGQATYPVTLLKREAPFGLIDPTSRGLEDRRDPDGIPAPEKPTDPPWLRKIYLPQHERFTLVCIDAICERFGTPPLDRRRVKQAGMIVRRLKTAPGPWTERWEDWFASDDGEGNWQEQFDATLHPVGVGDPEGIGLDPEEAGLQSHRLQLIPVDPDQQQPAPCRLYGYLPVWSAERQGRADPAASLAARQARTRKRLAELQSAWGSLAARPTEVLKLLELTLLPTTRGSSATEPADFGILLSDAIQRLTRSALDATRFQADITGNCVAAAALWTLRAGAGDVAANKHPTDSKAAEELDALLRIRLVQAVQHHVTNPASSGLSDSQWLLLLAAALVRARGHLLVLARAIERALASSQPGFRAASAGQWLATLPAREAADAGSSRPGAAVHSLGALMDWAALFQQKDGTLRVAEQVVTIANQPGDQPPFLEVLSCLQNLQKQLASAAQLLGTSSSSIRAALAKQGREEEAKFLLDAGIDVRQTDLASLGVPLDESPAEGLLVAPRVPPESSVFNALQTAALPFDAAGSRLSMASERAEQASTELRYDSQHLYAVWCWVRVAGRSPCEREQWIWSSRSEPFRIAEPHDLLGARPVSLPMPDLPGLVRDMGRLVQARARPFAAVRTPPQSGFVATDLSNISRRMGLGGSCSFGIPVFTICALVMFSIVFSILSLVLRWLPFLQICTPHSDDPTPP